MAVKWKIEGQIHSLKGTTPENKIDIVHKGKRKQNEQSSTSNACFIAFIFHWSLAILNLELPIGNWKQFCVVLKHLKAVDLHN